MGRFPLSREYEVDKVDKVDRLIRLTALKKFTNGRCNRLQFDLEHKSPVRDLVAYKVMTK
jgi:hypothetical protein